MKINPNVFLIAILAVVVTSSLFQNDLFAQSPPKPTSIGILQFNLIHSGCLIGFFGSAGGSCSPYISDMPIGLEVPIPTSGHLSNLYVAMSMMDTSSYTVYVNNVATPLSCTMVSGSLDCHDTTHSIAVNAGDHVMIYLQNGDPSCIATATVLLGI